MKLIVLVACCAAAVPAVGESAAPPAAPGAQEKGAGQGAGNNVEIRIDAERLKIVSPNDSRLAEGSMALHLDYRYSGPSLFKPYVAGLPLDWGGRPESHAYLGPVNPLRDAPHDHLHHHALMFAVNIGDVEFWGVEGPACGRQVHKAFADVQGPGPGGRVSFTERLEWQSPAPAGEEGKVLLLEERRLSLAPAPAGKGPVLDWESVFRAGPGLASVKLTGREYEGLGVRLVESMDKGGRFLNAEGETGVAGTNRKRSRWCSYAAPVDERRNVTLAMFDDPRNPRSPADWFTMDGPFAYMSITLGLDAEPLELAAGKELRVRYGVALFPVEADGAAIEAAYRSWLEGKP